MGKNKETNYILIGLVILLVTLLSSIVGGYFGLVQYNYELDRCTNLHDSTYDFNVDVQLNAEYAKDCFYINNHPLAMWGYLIESILIAILICITIVLMCVIIKLSISLGDDYNTLYNY